MATMLRPVICGGKDCRVAGRRLEFTYGSSRWAQPVGAGVDQMQHASMAELVPAGGGGRGGRGGRGIAPASPRVAQIGRPRGLVIRVGPIVAPTSRDRPTQMPSDHHGPTHREVRDIAVKVQLDKRDDRVLPSAAAMTLYRARGRATNTPQQPPPADNDFFFYKKRTRREKPQWHSS